MSHYPTSYLSLSISHMTGIRETVIYREDDYSPAFLCNFCEETEGCKKAAEGKGRGRGRGREDRF